MPVPAIEELEEVTRLGGGGPRKPVGPSQDGGRGDGESRRGPEVGTRAAMTGIWLAIAAIVMFFAALTSAYVVRKGTSDDWAPFPLPKLLWLNTAVLLASSGTLELARRSRGRGLAPGEFRRWWGLTTALGVAFLVGQVLAWRQLVAAGVYLATNPSGSFFYVLTAAHALHLLGGVLALLYAAARGRTDASAPAVKVAAVYWHFMGGLWLYVLVLLHLGGWS